MASIPQFYSQDYAFPTEFSEYPNTFMFAGGNSSCSDNYHSVNAASSSTGLFWGEENLVPLFDNFGLERNGSWESDTSSSVMTKLSSYPDHHQQCEIQDTTVPDYNMPNFYGINAAIQNSSTYRYQPEACVFGDNRFSFQPDLKPPLYPVASENWAYQSDQMPAIEETNMKVGRYSEEERKERILRYLKKRHQRNFNKTIKYACRKTLADRRVRVRGRFARNNELCDQETIAQNNDVSPCNHKQRERYPVDSHVQMKQDDEDWLQEVASLLYLPYITS